MSASVTDDFMKGGKKKKKAKILSKLIKMAGQKTQ